MKITSRVEPDLLVGFLGCPDTPEPSTTPFAKRKNSSLEEPWLECAGKYRPGELAQPDCVAPGLGYDAQSRRHNISDYKALITGTAAANNHGLVAKEKPSVCMCSLNRICVLYT